MKRLLLVVLVALAACSDDNGGTVVANTGAGERTRLTIERVDTSETATISCDPPEGTGWLADTAGEACALLDDEALFSRLVEGPPADQMCTQIYGGPEEALVTGTVDGEAVDTRFHRADGCGIGDWDTFEVLLGPAGQ